MAAGAWTFYNSAKKHLMDAQLDLDAGGFRITLHTSASNALTALATISTYAGLTGQVTSANGYSSSGKALGSPTWGTGASASEMRFNAAATVWTAGGGSISAVKFAVISQGTLLLCVSQLSTAQFSVTSGNTLTITPSANGIFELN